MTTRLPVLVAAIAVGCTHAGPVATVKRAIAPPDTPDQKLLDSNRSGAYQIAASMDNLSAAHDGVAAMLKSGVKDPELKAAMTDAQDLIDGSGEALGTYSRDPGPPPNAADAWRLKAIEACNDARHDLSDANGGLDTFLEGASQPVAEGLNDIESNLDDAIEALTSAVESLGGKPEPLDDGSTESGTADDTADPG